MIVMALFTESPSSLLRLELFLCSLLLQVVPGETALAFYTAYNPTDSPIIGISTYNVIPFEAGQYFNKIQCFCFEEQRLNPKEQVCGDGGGDDDDGIGDDGGGGDDVR